MIFPNHEERLWRRSNGIAAAMTVAVCSVSLLASPLQNAGSNSTSQRQKNERTSVLIGRVTAISALCVGAPPRSRLPENAMIGSRRPRSW